MKQQSQVKARNEIYMPLSFAGIGRTVWIASYAHLHAFQKWDKGISALSIACIILSHKLKLSLSQ
jgi:hypothetical protein